MQNLLYDLRFALRQLRNTLGIAVLAILTLALGVGANTAIFTVIDSVLLRPLPYAHSDRLIFIAPKSRQAELRRHLVARTTATFAPNPHFFKMWPATRKTSASWRTRTVRSASLAPRVTPSLFTMLGGRALLGRTFTEAEGVAGGPSVVLLSEGLWRQSFPRRSAASWAGRSKSSGKPYTVVGVMPASIPLSRAVGP